jgi:hypothetical protein
MIALRQDITLSTKALTGLKKFQNEIDQLTTFSEKSKKAKELFPKKNTKKNSVFNEVKKGITLMCNSTRRCVYCEDSLADEVEHIYPKDLFPEKCFDWDNYVYACGPCNGPKNNQFAIFRADNGKFQSVNPPKGTPATAPPLGEAALINPRIENPLDYCILDLAGTFKFVLLPNLTSKDRTKADYTYNTVLRLNDVEREPLRQARENAFGNYRARLFEYVNKKRAGEVPSKLQKMIEGIQKENHPTVWREMQRQHTMGLLAIIDTDLNNLFLAEPEALTW